MRRSNRLGPAPEPKAPPSENHLVELRIRNAYVLTALILVSLTAVFLRGSEDWIGYKWLLAAIINLLLGYLVFIALYRKASFDSWSAIMGSLGSLLLIGGLGVLLYYQLFYDVRKLVEIRYDEYIHGSQIDLVKLAQKKNATLWSVVAMFAGFIAFGFGLILSRLKK